MDKGQAVGRVEAEGIRTRLFVGETVFGIHQIFGVGAGSTCFDVLDENESVAHFKGSLQALAQSFGTIGLHLEAVDHQLDVVHFVTAHLHPFHQVLNFSINADLGVALLTDLFEQLPVVALPAANERSQHDQFFTRVFFSDLVFHFLLGEAQHRFAADVAVGGSGAGVKQAEKIIDLGNGAEGTWL